MHSKMTSPFYPTVLVVWGSSVAFCYKCLRVFLSFCSTDGKVGWDITKGFVGCSEPLLFLLMLWQVSRCCPAVRDPKCHLPFGLCGDDNLLLECKQDSFHIWPPTPPRISLWNRTSAIMTHLGQSNLFVCDLPGVNFNNLLWASLSLCRVLACR